MSKIFSNIKMIFNNLVVIAGITLLNAWVEVKRVFADVVVVAGIMLIYILGLYTLLPPSLQLVALKSLLVSMGLLTAHISGKLLFPKMNWDCPMTAGHYARIALYVVCVYAYSVGG